MMALWAFFTRLGRLEDPNAPLRGVPAGHDPIYKEFYLPRLHLFRAELTLLCDVETVFVALLDHSVMGLVIRLIISARVSSMKGAAAMDLRLIAVMHLLLLGEFFFLYDGGHYYDFVGETVPLSRSMLLFHMLFVCALQLLLESSAFFEPDRELANPTIARFFYDWKALPLWRNPTNAIFGRFRSSSTEARPQPSSIV